MEMKTMEIDTPMEPSPRRLYSEIVSSSPSTTPMEPSRRLHPHPAIQPPVPLYPKIGTFIRHPTASEDDLLNPNYWFQSDLDLFKPCFSDQETKKTQESYNYVLGIVSKAYHSIKQRNRISSDDLLLVLRDYATSSALFQFATSFKRMHDTYLKLEEMQRIDLGVVDATTTHLQPVEKKSYSGSSTSQSFLCVDYELEMQEELVRHVKRCCYSCSLKFMESTNFTSRTEALCHLEKFLLAVEEELIRAIGKPQEDTKVSIKIQSICLLLHEILNQMDTSTHVSIEDNEIMHCSSAEGDIHAAETLCIECNKVLNGMDNSEVVKGLREAVVTNNLQDSLFSELLHAHLNLFQENMKHGFGKRYILDDESVEILRSLEARVSKLSSDIMHKVVFLKEVGSSELKNQVDTLRKALLSDLQCSVSIIGDCQEIFKIFYGVIECMDQHDVSAVWHASRPKKMHMQL